jgi:hypothetical protein
VYILENNTPPPGKNTKRWKEKKTGKCEGKRRKDRRKGDIEVKR